VLGMVDVELIKKMHERDHSIREIARMTGWSRQTVRKTLIASARLLGSYGLLDLAVEHLWMRPVSTTKKLRIRSRCESTALVRHRRYASAKTRGAEARATPNATHSREHLTLRLSVSSAGPPRDRRAADLGRAVGVR